MDTTSITSHPSLIAIRPTRAAVNLATIQPPDNADSQARSIPGRPLAIPKPGGPVATPGATPQTPGGLSAPDQSSQSMVEQLKADWGKADSPWDLNEDGTVDVRDFLKLLAKMSGVHNDAPTMPENEGSTPVPQQIVDPDDGATENKSPIQQLLADWGKADSPWDLNEDGTVDVRDFLQLLGQLYSDGSEGPPNPGELGLNAESVNENPGDGAAQPENKTPIQQLLDDWGKSDSRWDLNKDGTVNIRDFLQLLGRLGSGPHGPQTVPGEPRPHAEPVAMDLDNVEQPRPQSPIQQLLADWGKSDSRWDLNGDGTVNIRDFLSMLAKMSHGREPMEGPQERDVPRVTHVTRRARSAYHPTAAPDTSLIRSLGFNAVG
ncbi:MAG: hypothetical protein ACYSU7_00040 [Planctomycetota bacterium]|jgi:hypothetical protein